MSTAQQLFVDEFVNKINNSGNLNPYVIASSPSAGYLRVTTKNAGDAPRANFVAPPASSVTGAGTFVTSPATGVPEYVDLAFSWTLAPGDVVKINVGATARSLDLIYTLPPGTTVDPGGFDHSAVTAGPGGGATGTISGGTGTNTAQDRRFVTMECGKGSTSFGSLFALDPNVATGIPIPAFQVGNAKPVIGSTTGEGYYDTTAKTGYVWDGAAWRDITASPILQFPTVAALLADTTAPVGAYAVALDTGRMFIRRTTGWVELGIAVYTALADLLADAPGEGTIAEALDDQTLWYRTSAGWRSLFPRHLADTAAVTAWASGTPGASAGDMALAIDVDVLYIRGAAGWVPSTTWVNTEANIRASTWAFDGQSAISSDTGRVFERVAGTWVEEPINHFATEVLLLAATSPDGTLAWADDTNVVFIRAGGAWKRLAGPQMSVGAVEPSTPGTGDMFFDTSPAKKGLEVWDGTAWGNAGTPNAMLWMVGSIQESVLTEAQFAAAMGAGSAASWVLADGRDVTGSAYETITGDSTVPDLRGAYLVSAGANSNGKADWDGGVLKGVLNWMTGLSRVAMRGTAGNNGTHQHYNGTHLVRAANSYGASSISGSSKVLSNSSSAFTDLELHLTSSTGSHTHDVTIDGGGDPWTRPNSFAVHTYIKVN